MPMRKECKGRGIDVRLKWRTIQLSFVSEIPNSRKEGRRERRRRGSVLQLAEAEEESERRGAVRQRGTHEGKKYSASSDDAMRFKGFFCLLYIFCLAKREKLEELPLLSLHVLQSFELAKLLSSSSLNCNEPNPCGWASVPRANGSVLGDNVESLSEYMLCGNVSCSGTNSASSALTNGIDTISLLPPGDENELEEGEEGDEEEE